jgi:lysozyme
MLTISPDGEALIKHYEGCKLTAYPDPATGRDPWTIGWGTTGKDIHKGLVWTQAQCDARFQTDIVDFAKRIAKLVDGAATTQHQFDAFCSFAYNIGVDDNHDGKAQGLGDSTLMRKHKAGDYAGAQAEFVRWNKANGKVLDGLTKRRSAEAALYGTPADQPAPKL